MECWLPAFTVRTILPQQLENKQKLLLLSSFAKSTLATYGTGLAKYHIYCDTIALPEIYRAPTTTTILAGFITFLSGSYSKSAIVNFVAAVKAWHLINSLPYDINTVVIHKLLQGAQRIQPLPLPKREPLTVTNLARLLQHLNLENYEQAATAACLTTIFYSCARVGE